MKPFELSVPEDLAAAVRKAGPEATYKAAGIDLIDRMKERVLEPGNLVDLLPLERELRHVRADDAGLTIGALTPLQQIADAPELAASGLRALREACGEAATPQVRRRATLGGNLLQLSRCWYLRSAAFGCTHGGDGPDCLAREGENRYHAVLGGFDCVRVHPSNAAPALCALGAVARIRGGAGEREIPVRELWPPIGLAALAEHTLAPDEILLAVRIPAEAAAGGSAWRESREKLSFDWPTSAAAVHLRIEGGRIRRAAVCLGAVAPVPWISEEARKALEGQAPSAETFRKAADAAFASAQPLSQNAYKIQVGKAILVDALTAAAEE
jgi:xanthine dehydrogenase YagS FAD-binding subunit